MTDAQLRADLSIQDDYGDILALYPDHQIEMDGTILRWKRDPMMRWLADHVDINAMWVAYYHGAFPLEDFTRFYRHMGYSLYGFVEVFGDELGLHKDEEDSDDN